MATAAISRITRQPQADAWGWRSGHRIRPDRLNQKSINYISDFGV